MDKIKAFFASKAVKVVSWVVLALACVSLIIGGIATDTINSGVVLVSACVSAVSAVIAFINSNSKE